jgi:threonine dehydratase
LCRWRRRFAGGSGACREKLRPKAQVIAVEANNVASFSAALKAGEPTRIDTQPTLADGLAIPQVGTNAFNTARDLVDRCVLVSEEQIALAILRIVEVGEDRRGRIGRNSPRRLPLGVSCRSWRATRWCCCSAAGNIDPNVLSRVVERGLVSDGRLGAVHRR